MSRYEPCGCGAEDCNACHPENRGKVECPECGRLFRPEEDAETALCDRCTDARTCADCGEPFEDGVCARCIAEAASLPAGVLAAAGGAS